jgi:hypothetical protein
VTGPVLETVLTAPPARGVRGLVSAVAFYARTPAARPRPGRLHRVLWGVGVTLEAARLVVADRALLRAALRPTLLTAAACLALAGLATVLADPEERGAGTTFQAFLVSFVALASMPPTVLQRLWLRLANESRRALGMAPGDDPFAGVSFLTMVWRETVKAARQAAVVSLGLVPLLATVRLLPGGRTEATVLGAGWAFYWVVIDAFELPMDVLPGPRHGGPETWFVRWHHRAGELSMLLRPARLAGRLLSRLSRPWREEIHFTERHGFESAGFGVAAGVVLALPVVGLFFRAVAIVAATALVGRLDGEPGAPEP